MFVAKTFMLFVCTALAERRVYAAYGGVYVATAIVWLWLIDGARPTAWDLVGAMVTLAGMAIIIAGARPI